MKKAKYEVETGYFEDNLPYAKIGNKPNILFNIEALSFSHKPPSGFMLRQYIKQIKIFLEDYTVYLVSRKPNLPESYTFDNMAEDYANLIRREFKGQVDVIGTSTGGQIAQYLAAFYPDAVRKLVIISAAFRLSEEGSKIESKAAKFYEQKKYGKSMAAIMELIYPSGFKSFIFKSIGRLFGKILMGKNDYPNDFLIEVREDRRMNFKERLTEIKAPTLIISGDNDIDYAIEDVRITADGIPNSKLILFEGYGHNLAMVNGKKVYEEVLNFLKE